MKEIQNDGMELDQNQGFTMREIIRDSQGRPLVANAKDGNKEYAISLAMQMNQEMITGYAKSQGINDLPVINCQNGNINAANIEAAAGYIKSAGDNFVLPIISSSEHSNNGHTVYLAITKQGEEFSASLLDQSPTSTEDQKHIFQNLLNKISDIKIPEPDKRLKVENIKFIGSAFSSEMPSCTETGGKLLDAMVANNLSDVIEAAQDTQLTLDDIVKIRLTSLKNLGGEDGIEILYKSSRDAIGNFADPDDFERTNKIKKFLKYHSTDWKLFCRTVKIEGLNIKENYEIDSDIKNFSLNRNLIGVALESSEWDEMRLDLKDSIAAIQRENARYHERNQYDDMNADTLTETLMKKVSEAARSEKAKEMYKTGAYLSENYKTLTRFANDASKFLGQKEDILQADDIKPIASATHVASSVFRAFFGQDVGMIMPLINTALFNAREHTDYLKSDNEIVQCAIDMAASSISGFIMFNPVSALISTGITGARCGIKLLDNSDMLLSIADAADAVNDAYYATNPLIRGIELIKFGYAGYAAGNLTDITNAAEKLTSYICNDESYIPELFSRMLCNNATDQEAVMNMHTDI